MKAYVLPRSKNIFPKMVRIEEPGSQALDQSPGHRVGRFMQVDSGWLRYMYLLQQLSGRSSASKNPSHITDGSDASTNGTICNQPEIHPVTSRQALGAAIRHQLVTENS